MTPSGEQLTLKGEFNHYQENTFSLNNRMAISYGINLEDKEKVEITLGNIEGRYSNCYQMVFVLKGTLSLRDRRFNTSIGEISTQQHNFCRLSTKSVKLVMSEHDDEIVCINISEEFLSRYLTEEHPLKKTFFKSEAI